MVRRCIYCGTETDLSKSDIIPDALTNGKIINPNVCRVAHNNKFSDMFEDEVISKLAFITNELEKIIYPSIREKQIRIRWI